MKLESKSAMGETLRSRGHRKLACLEGILIVPGGFLYYISAGFFENLVIKEN